MAQKLVGFNWNEFRCGLSENDVDHMRIRPGPDCLKFKYWDSNLPEGQCIESVDEQVEESGSEAEDVKSFDGCLYTTVKGAAVSVTLAQLPAEGCDRSHSLKQNW